MVLNNWYKLMVGAWIHDNNPGMRIIDHSGKEAYMGTYVYSSTLVGSILRSHSQSSTGYGVVFGNGTVPPTPEDYKLSGSIVGGLAVTYKLEPSADSGKVTGIYTITNTGSADVTISEVGLRTYFYDNEKDSHQAYIERTLLDSPITIAPDGVGQITYTLNFTYPGVTAAATGEGI